MTISHYWVSGIQVAGLIVGLYGFFFLSIGIFGVKSIPWFRSLLPASGMLLGTMLAVFPSLGTEIDSPAIWVGLLAAWLLYYGLSIFSGRLIVMVPLREGKLSAYVVLVTATLALAIVLLAGLILHLGHTHLSLFQVTLQQNSER